MMFVDSHVHYIEEDPLEYIDTLLRRMNEHNVEKAVLFGVQGHPLCSDGAVWHVYERFADRFIPFACSLRCEQDRDLRVFLDYLDTFDHWEGVGEIYVDLGPHDGSQKFEYRDGSQHEFQSYCPSDKDKNTIYQGLFSFCAERSLPVLVHCVSCTTMRSMLAQHPNTTFIWAHADWSLPVHEVTATLNEHQNLYCDIGAQFRFSSENLLGARGEEWELNMVSQWRRAAENHSARIVWGSDIFTWNDLHQDAYKRFIDVWHLFSETLSEETKRRIASENLLELLRSNTIQRKNAQQGAALEFHSLALREIQ